MFSYFCICRGFREKVDLNKRQLKTPFKVKIDLYNDVNGH